MWGRQAEATDEVVPGKGWGGAVEEVPKGDAIPADIGADGGVLDTSCPKLELELEVREVLGGSRDGREGWRGHVYSKDSGRRTGGSAKGGSGLTLGEDAADRERGKGVRLGTLRGAEAGQGDDGGGDGGNPR